MAAAPTVPAWHGELVCTTAEDHAAVVLILQHFLDGDDTELNISNEHIEELPPRYFTHAAVRTRLKQFSCHNNALTELPAELGQLAALKRFRCNNNDLTTIPAELGQLAALVAFYCYRNNLTTLPAELSRLISLELFYCHNNRLTELPAELGRCEKLGHLSCSNNEGLEAYWAELEKHGDPATYKDMNPEDLAEAWKARWAQMSSRRVKAAR